MKALAGLRELADKKLEYLVNRLELAIIAAHSKIDREAVEAEAGKMLAAFTTLEGLAMPKSPDKWLSNPERDVDFTNLVELIGKGLSGGRIYRPELLLSEIVTKTARVNQPFWAEQTPGMLASLLRDKPEIRRALDKQGVLAWIGDEGWIRLVNVNWLTEPEDIAKFVLNEAKAGKCCRFCEAQEAETSLELQPVGDDGDGAYDVLISGMGGKRTQIIRSDYTYTHVPCRPHWLRWVEIARNREAAA